MWRILAPAEWPQPKGYVDGVAAKGTLIAVAGQVGWDEQHCLAGPGVSEQAAQALRNICRVVAEAGGKPEHIVRLTWFLTSKDAYVAERKELGLAYRSVMGKHYPAMTAVQVVALMVKDALVEIEALAVIPDA